MTVRVFIVGSFVVAVTGAAAWGLIVTQLSPLRAGALGFVLFFLSFFVAVASLVALGGYGIRRLLLRQQFPVYAVRTSLRQGIMIGLFSVLLLFLQLIRLYRWWIAVAAIAVMVSVELVFLSYDRSIRRHSATVKHTAVR